MAYLPLFLFAIATLCYLWFVLVFYLKLTGNPCVPDSIPGPGTNNLKHLVLRGLSAFFVLGVLCNSCTTFSCFPF